MARGRSSPGRSASIAISSSSSDWRKSSPRRRGQRRSTVFSIQNSLRATSPGSLQMAGRRISASPAIANVRGLLVGDVAGAVSPLTAGGLDGALRLSELAADVIAAYLDRPDPLTLRQYDGTRFQARLL